MYKKCPYTGEIFTPKRKNQIFSTAKARRDYHNDIASSIRHIKAPIDKALEKNYQILSSRLDKGGRVNLSKDELLLSGYNPSFFTHFDMLEGKRVACLYHFAVIPNDSSDLLTIIFLENAA
jgi:hypothetical protein